jgi:hypothetical protein
MAVAQGEIKGAVKAAENPAYARGGKASKYADLASVWDACREALGKHGLAVIQSPSTETDGEGIRVILTTRLCHSSGEWLEGSASARPASGLPQAVGSAITYLRRYALASFVGVAPEDDDGNAGSGIEPKVQPKKTVAESAKTADDAARERKALLDGLSKDLADWPELEVEALHQRVIKRSKPAKASLYSLGELRALKAAAQRPEPPSEATKAGTTGSSSVEDSPPSADQQKALASEKARILPAAWTTILTDTLCETPEKEMTEAQAERILEMTAQEPDSSLPGFDEDGKEIHWIVCPKGCGAPVRWTKSQKGNNITVGEDGKPHLFSCEKAK